MLSDTIFALSTGALPSGVAVVRLSGSACADILQRVTGRTPSPAGQLSLRTFRGSDDILIDRGLVAFFRAPASFTGEDCLEFHCHGGRAVVASLMKELATVPGVRAAERGEFARRAFLNGKMDLTQAEGLADLIEADTEAQKRQALDNAGGTLRRVIEGWQDRLTHIRARLEADLDFSDQEDVVPDDQSHAIAELKADMEAALRASARGEIVRDGFRVVIAGPPNVGKSSLLNALVEREAAIVTDIAGTTRDLVEVGLDLDGYKMVLTDTAGLHDSVDAVERIGIERAREAMAQAHLVLAMQRADLEPLALEHGGAILHVGSMIDRHHATDGHDVLVSVQVAESLDRLRHHIRGILSDMVKSPDSLGFRVRHLLHVRTAVEHFSQALLAGGDELVAEDLRLASDELGRITGRVDVELILGRIFSEFCIGK